MTCARLASRADIRSIPDSSKAEKTQRATIAYLNAWTGRIALLPWTDVGEGEV